MTELDPMDQNLTLELSLAEILVLSDCLDRLTRQESLTSLIDKAEQIALWSLDCALEKINPVIFSANYDKHLQEAKSRITRGTDE